jgi:hypothetical protein
MDAGAWPVMIAPVQPGAWRRHARRACSRPACGRTYALIGATGKWGDQAAWVVTGVWKKARFLAGSCCRRAQGALQGGAAGSPGLLLSAPQGGGLGSVGEDRQAGGRRSRGRWVMRAAGRACRGRLPRREQDRALAGPYGGTCKISPKKYGN